MAPIRVALIGLSATAKTSWASVAHLPYLLSPKGRSKYEIVALLNSSVDAARAAIIEYGLPATTHAYGSPDDLAADPDVDLVVCNTRVDVHAQTIAPSVAAGKAVFCEWPLASNAAEAERLVESARRAGNLSKTVVGLQGRVIPLAIAIRGLIASGRIGKVLSSEWRAFGGTNDRTSVPKGLSYFYNRDVGGNIYTIGFAHAFDTILSTLGDIDREASSGHFQLQRPDVQYRDGETVVTTKSNTPDLILAAGVLRESPTTQQGATLHLRYRRGQPFPDDPAMTWSINGEKGEIRLLSPVASFLNIGSSIPPFVLKVHDFEKDKVEEIAYDWEDWEKELDTPARGIGRLYEEFAKVQASGERTYATFEDALQLHQKLERLIGDWKA